MSSEAGGAEAGGARERKRSAAEGPAAKGTTPKGTTAKGGSKAKKAGKGKAGKGLAVRQPREFSAGGVVVRDGREVVVIVPTRRAADGAKVLALPKGHVDPGETAVQAAAREVREETGVVGEPVCELGETRYWYRRDGRTIGKTVAFYLFRYVEGDIEDHDDEVEEVRWLTLEQAQAQLSHDAEQEMVALAVAYLEKDR